jgi:riboflavin transporter FmnP
LAIWLTKILPLCPKHLNQLYFSFVPIYAKALSHFNRCRVNCLSDSVCLVLPFCLAKYNAWSAMCTTSSDAEVHLLEELSLAAA